MACTTQNSILRRGAAVLSQSYRPNIHVPNFQFFFSPPTTSLSLSFYQVRQERRISLLIPAYPRQVGRNQSAIAAKLLELSREN